MVILGHVSNPHGIMGEIKVISHTEKSDGLCDYPVWWFGKQDEDWVARHPESFSVSGKHVIVKLREYNDRTSASTLTGQQIAVPRSHLPALPENGEEGYYWADLIGADIINLKGVVLGQVTGLLETGANDALQVRSPGSKQELLIPFIDQVIINVDLSSGKIMVDWEADY
ncbi:MAG: ribosome maturation factor RimM [Nitrosomonas sp.]|nr:ribosome maturation factor RimM [Nitrosomonas sp.]